MIYCCSEFIHLIKYNLQTTRRKEFRKESSYGCLLYDIRGNTDYLWKDIIHGILPIHAQTVAMLLSLLACPAVTPLGKAAN